MNGVKISDYHVIVNPCLLAGCSSLNELTLPIYSDYTSYWKFSEGFRFPF